MYDTVSSRYTYKGTNILKNKLNIMDKDLLDEYQNKMVAFKLASIEVSKFGDKFNENRLKAIHKYLFEDIFDFAGEYRLENITKDNFRFAEFQYIEENMSVIINKINVDELKKISIKEYIKRVSYILTELNVLHPFRERKW